MGSRLMHYTMARRLIKQFPQLHENRFLLGGIAPDAHFSNKEQAHFYTGDDRDHSRRIDYERYWETASKEDFSYRCGYYVHLIADELWLQGFYKSWLKQAIAGTPSIGERYHEDFRRYNTVLAKQFSVNRHVLQQEIEKLEKQTDVAQLRQLVDDVEQDTNILMEQTYDVVLVHQLEGYMESALNRCEQALENKLSLSRDHLTGRLIETDMDCRKIDKVSEPGDAEGSKKFGVTGHK